MWYSTYFVCYATPVVIAIVIENIIAVVIENIIAIDIENIIAIVIENIIAIDIARVMQSDLEDSQEKYRSIKVTLDNAYRSLNIVIVYICIVYILYN